MEIRRYWLDRIERLWKEKSVLWLSGVRRVGKTTLCQGLSNTDYFDCEIPRIRRLMEEPESFLKNFSSRRIVLDEIHRLDNPSELLKIAADHFPKTKILATGSSRLGASKKFRDTLTGRKRELWLTPMTLEDLTDFKRPDLSHRLLHGGLPPFFLADPIPEQDYQEWMDSFWAKDIQELFQLERRHSFQKLLELLFRESGGIFEATRFAAPCEVSRTTIQTYLKVLEETFVVHVIKPFHSRRKGEILSAPRTYGFDTGFVCYFRGWHQLRQDDLGPLWEHFVLNELQAHLQSREIYYWRDKAGHEIDFVLQPRGKPPIAIECKWSAKQFRKEDAFVTFQRWYPHARCFIVTQDSKTPFARDFSGVNATFLGIAELCQILTGSKPSKASLP